MVDQSGQAADQAPLQPPAVPAAATAPAAPSRAFQAGTSAAGAPTTPAVESTLWIGRTHWQHFLGRVVLGVIAVVLLAWLTRYLGVRYEWNSKTVWIVALATTGPVIVLVLGSVLYRILKNRYRLTGQRLFIERGILSQTIDQTELIRVDDVRLHKRFIDRLLGMGTVEIRSTDATDGAITIEGIKNAERVAELVRTSMHTLRSKSLFIENL